MLGLGQFRFDQPEDEGSGELVPLVNVDRCDQSFEGRRQHRFQLAVAAGLDAFTHEQITAQVDTAGDLGKCLAADYRGPGLGEFAFVGVGEAKVEFGGNG